MVSRRERERESRKKGKFMKKNREGKQEVVEEKWMD